MKTVGWEAIKEGSAKFWVVESGGMLRTGPFSTKEEAVDWFRKEVDVDISIEEKSDERESQEEEQHAESEITTEDTECTDGKGPTEVFYGHCSGCAASR